MSLPIHFFIVPSLLQMSRLSKKLQQEMKKAFIDDEVEVIEIDPPAKRRRTHEEDQEPDEDHFIQYAQDPDDGLWIADNESEPEDNDAYRAKVAEDMMALAAAPPAPVAAPKAEAKEEEKKRKVPKGRKREEKKEAKEGEEEGDEKGDLMEPESKEGKDYDFYGRSLLITWLYPNDHKSYPTALNTDLNDVLDFARSPFDRGDVTDWTVGRERCPTTDTFHFHAFIELRGKIHRRKLNRSLIYLGQHPNISVRKYGAGKNKNAGHIYCAKSNDYITSQKLPSWQFNGFEQRQRDFDSRNTFIAALRNPLLCPEDIEFPGGWKLRDHINGRKNSVWLWGPANTGKSFWFQQVAYNKRFVTRINGAKNPWDLYQKERCFLIDDPEQAPSKEELTNILTLHSNDSSPIYGGTRYHPKTYIKDPIKQKDPRNKFNVIFDLMCFVVVIANFEPQYVNEPWFATRFFVKHTSDVDVHLIQH